MSHCSGYQYSDRGVSVLLERGRPESWVTAARWNHGSTAPARCSRAAAVRAPIPLSCDQRKPTGRGLARAMIAAAMMPIGPSKTPAAAIPVAVPVRSASCRSRSASCRSRSASCRTAGSFRIPLPPHGPAVGFVIATAIIRGAAYADGRHISAAGIFRWNPEPGWQPARRAGINAVDATPRPAPAQFRRGLAPGQTPGQTPGRTPGRTPGPATEATTEATEPPPTPGRPGRLPRDQR
jgi:hypothetical protein